jgi:hypothetical protein
MAVPIKHCLWLASTALLLVAILGTAGCGGLGKDTSPSVPLLPLDALQSTWTWQVAFDTSLSEDFVARVGGRWLGAGDAQWSPLVLAPSAAKGPLLPLERRERLENAEALALLGDVYLDAACVLAQSPNSYGEHVALGYQIGLSACEKIGVQASVSRAAQQLQRFAPGGPNPSDSVDPATSPARPLTSPVGKSVVIEGEQLSYRFFRADEFSSAAEGVRAGLKSGEAERSTLEFRIGTSRWAESVVPDLRSAPEILAALGPTPDLASLEQAAEESLAVLRRALQSHGPSAPEPLGRSEVSLLMTWARRAVYRDLGLGALRRGHYGAALPLLEEAAGSSGRIRPGPGLDPVLLAGVVKARYQNNQGLRTVDLLRTISQQEGWGASAVIADLVARKEVLPSNAGAEVRR